MHKIIPAPKEIVRHDGVTVLDSSWGIDDQSGLENVGHRFARELGISSGKQKRNVAFVRREDLKSEEYRLEIGVDAVTVTAKDARGFLYALATIQQLRSGPVLQRATVRDYPRLRMRGFHLMFEAIQQLGAAEATTLINSAARLKLNTLLFEFGPRFPFERHATVRSPAALTRTELRKLVELARSHGMECIPLQQSLGHLEYLLQHETYAHLREEDEHRAQMCPSNPDSFRVFTELAEEVLAYFPESRYLHIGADETRQLGVCPRCRAVAKESLYVRHINQVCEWVTKRNLQPILWDDILCAHPQILDQLHPSAGIMYWDYWTTQSPSPLVVARYNPNNLAHVVYDKRWLDEWKQELPDVAAETLRVFGKPKDLQQRLDAEFLRVFGSYLGNELPKFIRAFPYLEYYRDSGRKVFGAPAGASNTSEWLGLPDFPRYTHNIKTFADRCEEAGTEGIVTTAWYNFPYEALYPSLLATAQFAW